MVKHTIPCIIPLKAEKNHKLKSKEIFLLWINKQHIIEMPRFKYTLEASPKPEKEMAQKSKKGQGEEFQIVNHYLQVKQDKYKQ